MTGIRKEESTGLLYHPQGLYLHSRGGDRGQGKGDRDRGVGGWEWRCMTGIRKEESTGLLYYPNCTVREGTGDRGMGVGTGGYGDRNGDA